MSDRQRKPHFLGNGVHHATINSHRFHVRPLKDGALLWLDGQQPPYHLDQMATDFVLLVIDAMWKCQQGQGDESEQVIGCLTPLITPSSAGGNTPHPPRRPLASPT
jgi:hypothetical protein